MTKKEFKIAKQKEEQIQQLKENLNAIESGKILIVKIRTFDNEKTLYRDIEMTDVPKAKIKGIIRQNLQEKYNNAEQDLKGLFGQKEMN